MKKIFTRFVIFALLIALNVVASTIIGCGGGNNGQSATNPVDENPSVTGTKSENGAIQGMIGMNKGYKQMNVSDMMNKAAGIDMTSLVITLSGENSTFETKPDANGNFSFTDIPSGRYALNVKPNEEFPLQAYYPEANINVSPGKTLELSIPVVRGLPLGLNSDFELESMIINEKSGDILLHGNKGELLRVVDVGPGKEPSVDVFSNINDTYFGKDDEKELYYTLNVAESDMLYDQEWGTFKIGTVHDCNIIIYDSTFSAEAARSFSLGTKNEKLTQSAGWDCYDGKTCYSYYYNDEANCPLDHEIKNGVIYALAELTESDKKDGGVDEGRKLVVIDPVLDKMRSYLVDKGVGNLAINKDGLIYVIDSDKFEVDVIELSNGNAEVAYEVPFLKNGVQKEISHAVNPTTGSFYMLYQVNEKIGKGDLVTWLMVIDSGGVVLVDKRLSEILALNEPYDLNSCYDGTYATITKSSSASDDNYGYTECSASDKDQITNSIKAFARSRVINDAMSGLSVSFSGNGTVYLNDIPFKTDDSAFDVVVPDVLYPDFALLRCDQYGNYMYCNNASCNNGMIFSSYIIEEKVDEYLNKLHCMSNSVESPSGKYNYNLGSCSNGYTMTDHLGVGRYSSDYSDIDVYVGLLYVNQKDLQGLDINPITGRIYTYNPDGNELLVLE